MPADPKPLDHARVAALLEIEWNRFRDSTTAARDESSRAKVSSPLGVTSSFQYWDPYPLSIVKADGAYVTDVDGRQLLDMSMGFGGMLVGHRHPQSALGRTRRLYQPDVAGRQGRRTPV